ncbi:hypothetical protein CKM354_000162600 [Cercospora kikuchii]|uniref:Uncharacterized protein n=1 Tax=Cercospora kikuchii TaxID=84275 RepID=A0A9P3CGG2_9PEZI|nr:uncharacterized protein CKM354_000162600 [Cercospora kikuchii]GIZ38203.1 hypothetical protein CKM354_000162600 [Cercospora kikuchii]
MPPIRTVPIAKPIRTERTHEENQERAYIAASRRSDRSLEARVESARRASEIHKKRTGRSLRVREEDVMNEEMYEEEDDDLPMQFRRINALNPGFAYSAFNERVNSYLQGQIGVRNYLHQAIYQANQNYNANQMYNPMLQQTGQQAWQMNMQNALPASAHARSASIATPQSFTSQQQQSPGTKPTTPSASDAQRPASTAVSPAARSSTELRRQSSSSMTPASMGMQPQTPGQSAHPMQSPSLDGPLTLQLEPNVQQLVDGQQAALGVQPYMMSSGVPMPSMSYSYNPNGKSSKRDSPVSAQSGLQQTLSPYNMHHDLSSGSLYQEPMSAASAPGALDYNFGYDMLSSDFGANYNTGADSKYAFDLDLSSGHHTGNANNSGQVTPAGLEASWNPDDFFNYPASGE